MEILRHQRDAVNLTHWLNSTQAQTGRLVIFGFHTNLPTVSSTLSPLHWLRMAKGMASMPTFEPMDLVLSSKSIHGFNLSFACGVPSRGLRVDGAVVNA